MTSYIWLIPFFPMVGFLVNGLLGVKFKRSWIHIIAASAIGLSFLVTLIIFFELLKVDPHARHFENIIFDWIIAGKFKTQVAFMVDPLSIIMALVVSGVSFMIHIYSGGYMHGDPGFRRFFVYLNLFVFSMLILILANSFLLMFVGWEGVGLCSYLLIGFWFEKDSASTAGKKAFVVNRIGDFGFVLGLFLIVATLSKHGIWSLNFDVVFKNAELFSPVTVTAITLLLFVGATGKSAQIPLYVWLPDAMEGPTPVSSLIHAATMVTAGVYMIARCNVLYSMAPLSLEVVAIVGVLTAFFSATIALVQNDFKRILAYSTVSQLGYMFVGVGVGAFSAGIFHLMTHAFFKGLLFLASGSVMHAMAGELNIQKMGGLKKFMPVTFWVFMMATLAISGIPGFSGFFSKDEILWQSFHRGHLFVWIMGTLAAGLTAFYMFRLTFVAFFGKPRMDEEAKHHLHESPKVMTYPMIILAIASVIGGYVGIPAVLGGANRFEKFLEPFIGSGAHEAAAEGAHAVAHASASLEFTMMAISVIVALIGITVAYVFYIKNPELPVRLARGMRGLYTLLYNKYFVDEFYNSVFVQGTKDFATFLWQKVDVGIIDAIVNGVARLIEVCGGVIRKLQTGYVQTYAFSILVGGVVVFVYFFWESLF